MAMDSDETGKENLLFLDFNEKLPNELLQNKVFIRLINLKDKNPLIQINDLIFEGSYNYSIGTNLFFKKSRNDDLVEFPFREPTLFKLRFTDSQTKILSCKQMKVPSTTTQLPANHEIIKFNFKWDYKELLKKVEMGTLDLQDMVLEKDNEEPQPEVSLPMDNDNEIKVTDVETQHNKSMEMDNNIEITDIDMEISEITQIDELVEEPCNELKVAYENLQLLARTPVKRETNHEDSPCDPQFRNEYEYKSIECKILDPPLFSYMKHQPTNKRFEDCVNIERCITLGLLAPSDNYPRTLSDDEKNTIMKVENFENLNLTARYSVLLSYMEELKQQVHSNSSEQNCKKDEFNRTPGETLNIFTTLVFSLKSRIQNM